jgi:dsRNA-specific ribonuclease
MNMIAPVEEKYWRSPNPVHQRSPRPIKGLAWKLKVTMRDKTFWQNVLTIHSLGWEDVLGDLEKNDPVVKKNGRFQSRGDGLLAEAVKSFLLDTTDLARPEIELEAGYFKSNHFLKRIARELQLHKYVIERIPLGEAPEFFYRNKLAADLMERIIGALYEEQGRTKAYALVVRLILPYIMAMKARLPSI